MVRGGKGWYVHVAPYLERTIATDLFGPFDNRTDVVEWLAEHKIELKDERQFFRRSVPAFIEMTDHDLDGHSYTPWACQIEYWAG